MRFPCCGPRRRQRDERCAGGEDDGLVYCDVINQVVVVVLVRVVLGRQKKESEIGMMCVGIEPSRGKKSSVLRL